MDHSEVEAQLSVEIYRRMQHVEVEIIATGCLYTQGAQYDAVHDGMPATLCTQTEIDPQDCDANWIDQPVRAVAHDVVLLDLASGWHETPEASGLGPWRLLLAERVELREGRS